MTRGLDWRKLRTNCFALGDFYLIERFSQASKVGLYPQQVWFDQHWYCQGNPDIFSIQNKRLAHADLFNLKIFSFVKTAMGMSHVKGFWKGLLPEVPKYWTLLGKGCVRRNKVILPSPRLTFPCWVFLKKKHPVFHKKFVNLPCLLTWLGWEGDIISWRISLHHQHPRSPVAASLSPQVEEFQHLLWTAPFVSQ